MSPDVTCEAQAVFLSFGSFSFFAYAISKKENEPINIKFICHYEECSDEVIYIEYGLLRT